MNVDESFDALVNQVNSYTKSKIIQLPIWRWTYKSLLIISNELLRSFSEPVIVAMNDN